MRTDACPICGADTAEVLSLELGSRPPLGSTVPIHVCEHDEFAFVATGNAHDYAAYYANVANDGWQRDIVGTDSPSVEQAALLRRLLGELPPRILDFGCGSGDLLGALAWANPTSRFTGCDISRPALRAARQRISGLSNAAIVSFEDLASEGPFGLVIISHVLEHLLDFEILSALRSFHAENGWLYIEVPDALMYEQRPRQEFLYYFDRLHVNHFTSQALAAVAGRYGYSFVEQVRREIRYRDGGSYPALGALFRTTGLAKVTRSATMRPSLERYIQSERARFEETTQVLSKLPGVLVWGAGDNFHRAASFGGPLSRVGNMRVLDRRRFRVAANGANYETEPPEQTIRECRWPVVITVSEHRSMIERQVVEIDPSRQIYFV